MAEILIRRRRYRNVWPWLLGLLALALLPLPFMAADGDDATPAPAPTARGDTTVTRRDTTVPSETVAPRAGGPGGAERTTSTAAGAVASDSTGPGMVAAGSAATTRPAAPPSAAPPSAATRPAVTTTTTPPATAVATGTPLERFIAAGPSGSNERAYAEYATGALRLLADDLRRLGASTAGVRAVRANADSLQITARRSEHPDYARAAFLAAIRELDVLRGRHRVAVDTGGLRSAAWAIKPGQRLVAQRSTVNTFLERARDAVQALSRAAGLQRRR